MAPGRDYEVEVRIVPEATAEHLYDIDPADLAFRVQFTSRTPADRGAFGRHHLRLDLTDTRPGTYVLGVRVTEVASGISSLPWTTFIIRS